MHSYCGHESLLPTEMTLKWTLNRWLKSSSVKLGTILDVVLS